MKSVPDLGGRREIDSHLEVGIIPHAGNHEPFVANHTTIGHPPCPRFSPELYISSFQSVRMLLCNVFILMK